MDENYFDSKITLEEMVRSGKTVGDEMDPDVNVDDSVEEKISINTIKEEENLLSQTVGKKHESKIIDTIVPTEVKKKNGGVWFLVIIAIVMSSAAAWIYIF